MQVRRQLGFVGEPYGRSEAGRYARIPQALTTAGTVFAERQELYNVAKRLAPEELENGKLPKDLRDALIARRAADQPRDGGDVRSPRGAQAAEAGEAA